MGTYQAVFFDLDGTLIDTAPDMGGALNRLLQNHNHSELPLDAIRPHVSNGANVLIRLGFAKSFVESSLEELRTEFLEIYRRHLSDNSTLFDGMEELLAAIERHGTPWGIITNKPGWLTEPLLEQLDLRDRCASVVSADTCEERKPHPMPMYHACKETNVEPSKCIYVGDDLRDIQAGRSAGMTTVAAEYGYLGKDESVAEWNTDKTITKPTDLLTILGLTV